MLNFDDVIIITIGRLLTGTKFSGFALLKGTNFSHLVKKRI